MSYTFHFYNNTSDNNVVNKKLSTIGGSISTEYIHMTYNSPNYVVVLNTPNISNLDKINYMSINDGSGVKYYYIINKTFEHGKLSLVVHKDVLKTYWDDYNSIDLLIGTTSTSKNAYLKDNYVLSTRRNLRYAVSNNSPFTTSGGGLHFCLELAGTGGTPITGGE